MSLSLKFYLIERVVVMFYLGIDIAKVNHVASLIDFEGNVLIKAIKFTNSNEGFDKLLSSLNEYDLVNILVSMEATGHYWLSLYSALIDKGFNVSVFNPFQIKSYRGAYSNRKQKNDITDSIIIADYLRFFGSVNTKLPKDDILSLKKLTRFRSDLVSNIVTAKTNIIGLLDNVFPEYKKAFCDVFGTTSLALLKEASTAHDIANLNTKKLANILSNNSRGRFGTKEAKALKELAKNTFGFSYINTACSFEIKQLINQIIFLEEQVAETEVEIHNIYSKLDSHLLSVPGIGKTLAPIILAEIGDINTFDKPSKLTAFAGIEPTQNQSGNKSSTNEKTSKRGSPYLRHAIYNASLTAMKAEPTLRAYYDKKKAEGKHHSVALMGVSRKLLTIIYYVLKEDRNYTSYSELPSK